MARLAPQFTMNVLQASGFRVEASRASGHFVSRADMAIYCRTSADLAAFACRIAANEKAFSTLLARAALAGCCLNTETGFDGRTRYRLERANGRTYIASAVAEVNALLEVQQ